MALTPEASIGDGAQFFRTGDLLRAFHAAFRNSAVNSKNQIVKERTQAIVLKVLTSFKSNEIEQAVKTLDRNGIDLLMKYIYKGFEKPTENSSAILLQWHEKRLWRHGGVSSTGGDASYCGTERVKASYNIHGPGQNCPAAGNVLSLGAGSGGGSSVFRITWLQLVMSELPRIRPETGTRGHPLRLKERRFKHNNTRILYCKSSVTMELSAV
ncbi:unnamed protein product [Ranitomeya imitator]|uniref:Actin-related protein 2/3 complex subunit 5 n=1 Tax=Ranitomeya imitator TaxID=111125 RepID=A0ABN9MI06_9NEOB|nr:unnamed protein product [Ranitomeya imitator]